MLGYVLLEYPVAEFAFDQSRAIEFADDLRHERRAGTDDSAWELVQSSINTAFQRERRTEAACSDLNAKVAAGVIGCFRAGTFDVQGAWKSHWQVRLAQLADDTQGMIEQLLCNEPPVAEPASVVEGQLPLWEGHLPQF
jgi:hypothetical protein